MNLNCRPNLVSRGQLKYDSVRGSDFLLLPERVVKLNKTGALILSMCDGKRTITEIQDKLKSHFRSGKIEDDVVTFLNRVAEHGWVKMSGD
ncbi:MAG: pyrroloquinoline quinone biosynthesis peptide chaperone PqqD [Candidatus Melainabacteria bacterium]|nr:MAG: pyrroloquinoline quinone biosynthesis peptide chaperone PqqD [Candidatus Melainabacteria bacterium]